MLGKDEDIANRNCTMAEVLLSFCRGRKLPRHQCKTWAIGAMGPPLSSRTWEMAVWTTCRIIDDPTLGNEYKALCAHAVHSQFQALSQKRRKASLSGHGNLVALCSLFF